MLFSERIHPQWAVRRTPIKNALRFLGGRLLKNERTSLLFRLGVQIGNQVLDVGRFSQTAERHLGAFDKRLGLR